MASNESCEIALGSVLVSLLDPTRGDEVAFNRWYERDHFYAGVMVGPWWQRAANWLNLAALALVLAGLAGFLAASAVRAGRKRKHRRAGTRPAAGIPDAR